MITWIKTHPAQTAVVALSISLAASSAKLYHEYSTAALQLVPAQANPSSAQIAASPEEARLNEAIRAAEAAKPWVTEATTAPRLFASRPYVAINGKLERIEGRTFRPPVPNDWLLKYGLDPLDGGVLAADPDRDGFTTLQEWEGMDARSHLDNDGKRVKGDGGRDLPDDSTSPVDAGSHPPYHTRLVLERVEQIPFRLRFLTYDVNARKPNQVTVQINCDPGRSEYVEVGKALKGAPFEVRSFTQKMAPGPDETSRDVSSIVVIDRRNGQEVTLPKGEQVNSPESYGVLRHDWLDPRPGFAKEPQRFRVRLNETFALPPNGDLCRVTRIAPEAVEIALPSGEPYVVGRK
jgi:hypothetical protein